MSYPSVEQDGFLEDLLSRKEFYSLRADKKYNFRDPPINIDPYAHRYLKIHSHQLFAKNFLNPNTPYKRLHLMHGCHGVDTPIMMHDGTLEFVQNIKIGDVLMGDDSTPRTVLSLARGEEMMYAIHPTNSAGFVCNASHILCLKHTNGRVIREISIRDYLNWSRRNGKYLLYRNVIKFAEIPVTHPYLFGLDISSGSIPYIYVCNSVHNRLQLLAGIIDQMATQNDVFYKIRCLTRRFYSDMAYLCRSLGLFIIMDNVDHILHINGAVPVRRLLPLAKLINYNFVDFNLKPLGRAQYYGFELSGNGRYIVGDFIVTHNTGSGKTLAAVAVAQEFISAYKRIYMNEAAMVRLQPSRRSYLELDKITPTVFVLGFGNTKAAFVRELLKYPEFGFITVMEREELLKRQKMASAGLLDDIKHMKDYYSYIKKRITNKSRDGFYKFFGYDEFVNRLFLSDNVKLTELESVAYTRLAAGEQITLEDVFIEYINSGKIQINMQLMSMFENSLLICDEIHNTYNMDTKNNRGVAIQFLLDSVPTLTFLSMSATPINNSPTEVIELINYLISPGKKIYKRDFFSNPRTLLPGKLIEIGKLTKGTISFLQDANIKYYPKRIFVGDTLRLPKSIETFRQGEAIPYLKFTPCPMSPLHQLTYNHYIAQDSSIQKMEKSIYSVPTDGYSIYDIVFPNPDTDEYGIFRSGEVRNKIAGATQEWRDGKSIMVKKYSVSNNLITGDFLAKSAVGTYSTKYAKLLDAIIEIIQSNGGDPLNCKKIMIYHTRVKMSGVLLIQELLRMNNIIDEFSDPVDNTICCVCGISLVDHADKNSGHTYHPARFVIAHGDMDITMMDKSLGKFNSPDNSRGLKYMIMIGSKKIKESYDFKEIRHLVIMSLPTDIPTLIQVIGRCIRKNSHVNLPPEDRTVSIHIMLSTVNESVEHQDTVSPEMYRYIDKLGDYMVTQMIEREMNQNAIDATIHRDIIMPPELVEQYFPEGHGPVNQLGNLYFEPTAKSPEYKLGDLNLSTFTAYKHYDDEIKLLCVLIKRLFIIEPVWTYDTLWDTIRQPPVGIEVNPALFQENNFIIALSNLSNNDNSVVNSGRLTEAGIIERLFDPNEQFIYIGIERYKISQVDKYYILFPVVMSANTPINTHYFKDSEPIRARDRLLVNTAQPVVVKDIESYLRYEKGTVGEVINVNKYISENKIDLNYASKLEHFVGKYKNQNDIVGFLTEYSANFQMAFIEEAVTHAIGLAGGAVAHVGVDLESLYAQVLKLMGKFHVIVYLRELRKYTDMERQYRTGLPNLPDGTPMGYTSTKSVRLYDPHHDKKGGKWIEINKIALNKHMMYRENNVVIGYFEPNIDHMKFKLRKPVDIKSQAEKTGDTRLIERGIVCSTKSKKELLRIITSLGIPVSRLDKSDIRIKKLCEIIKYKLITNEIKERMQRGRLKYLYSWWDAQPLLE